MKEPRKARVARRIDRLVDGFARYVEAYDQQVSFTSEQLRLHRQAIELRRAAGTAREAILSSDFVRSLRATLEAWRLGVRGSRLAAEGAFAASLQEAITVIEELEPLTIDDPSPVVDVEERLWRTIDSLGVTDNRAKIVAGTKTLHHVLPDLVVPMDRMWTGMFFDLHPPQWQDPANQRRTFIRLHRFFSDVARRTDPQRYVDGRGWRTCRAKILDNALIGFCKLELSAEGPDVAADHGLNELFITVEGFPPAKNEALSMLGVGHSHAPRVRALLQAARDAIGKQAFVPVESGPVSLDVVVSAPAGQDPWDATNYLGGIADVLEEKSRRGALEHLGDLDEVWTYKNDRQIKEVSYRQVEAPEATYTVRIRELPPSGEPESGQMTSGSRPPTSCSIEPRVHQRYSGRAPRASAGA